MSELPPFNRTRGPSIPTQPGPFDFKGVSLRCFPLRADEDCLTEFVDDYLQLGEEDEVRYEVALPYVLLCFVNYGEMSSQATDIGVWSQYEVAFMVPLEWYEWECDEWVFRDWALLTPYIYVDDPTSITTGREVYGCPKERGWIYPELDPWTVEHTEPRRLITLKARDFTPGGQKKNRPVRTDLLGVDYTPTPLTAKLPPDPRLAPFYLIPRAVVGSVGTLGTLAASAGRLVLGGDPPSPGRRLEVLVDWIVDVLTRDPDAHTNLLNLKQFRDAKRHDDACYQSIVNAEISLTCSRGAGLLGDVDLIRGDRSGGYEISIHRTAQRPIVEKLGLEVACTTRGPRGPIDTLRPQLPFWADLDLRYSVGEDICWRSQTPRWSVNGDPHRPPGAGEKPRTPYSEARGTQAAKKGLEEGFEFKGVTTRAFALRATQSKLQAFCDKYLNDMELPDEVGTFEAVLSTVLMFVTNFEEVREQGGEFGRWADHEIMFAVPALWTHSKDGEEKKERVLITPFIYADSSVAIATGREVVGWPTVKCELMATHDVWIQKDGPVLPRRLATIRAGVFKRLRAGERQEPEELLTIDLKPLGEKPDKDSPERDPRLICIENKPMDYWELGWRPGLIEDAVRACNPRLGPDAPMPTWEQIEARSWDGPYAINFQRVWERIEPRLQSIKDMIEWFENVHAPEHPEPIRFINLKQFRDSGQPERACYQAVVKVEHRITDVSEGPLWLDPDHHGKAFDIRLRVFEQEPILKMLGLDVKVPTDPPPRAPNEVALELATGPFWVRLDYTEEAVEKVCWRVRSADWET